MASDNYYDIIQKIRRTSGMNAKKGILACHPELKNILRTTYDPYLQFEMNVTESWQRETGHEQFSAKTNTLLNNLSSRRLTGNKARAAVKAHMNQLTYKSAYVLMLILNKSLDIGLAAKSINDIFPGLIPTHDIQLAKPFELRKCNFPCYTSPKLDGLRAPFKRGQFFSRKGHVFKGLTVLEAAMKELYTYCGLLETVQFDGELMVDGKHFNDISGDLRSFSETDNAHYYIFDAPDESSPLHARLNILNICAMANPRPDVISFVPHYTVTTMDGILNLDAQFREEGYEGSIIKQENSLYQNARTWDWMKIKDQLSEDCRVIGIFEGSGKYLGMAGGLVVDFNGVAVRVGSGLSDKQRMYWWDDQDEIVGKTVEVAYQEVTPDGSLRHPRLKVVRGDK